MNRDKRQDFSQTEEVQKLKEKVLSTFLELKSRDGVISVGLLRKHVALEMSSLLPQVLREMEEEGLIISVYGEGYELGIKLTAKAAIPLVYGICPLEYYASTVFTTIPVSNNSTNDARQIGGE